MEYMDTYPSEENMKKQSKHICMVWVMHKQKHIKDDNIKILDY